MSYVRWLTQWQGDIGTEKGGMSFRKKKNLGEPKIAKGV